MTADEWAEYCALIDNVWGQPPMDEEREAAYFLGLRGYPTPAVRNALERLIAEGGAFTPSLGQFVAKLEGRAAGLTFAEVLGLCREAFGQRQPLAARVVEADGIHEAHCKHGTYVECPSEQAAREAAKAPWTWCCECKSNPPMRGSSDAEALAWVEARDTVAGIWLRSVGIGALRDWDRREGAYQGRLERSYREFVDEAEERARAGQPLDRVAELTAGRPPGELRSPRRMAMKELLPGD